MSDGLTPNPICSWDMLHRALCLYPSLWDHSQGHIYLSFLPFTLPSFCHRLPREPLKIISGRVSISGSAEEDSLLCRHVQRERLESPQEPKDVEDTLLPWTWSSPEGALKGTCGLRARRLGQTPVPGVTASVPFLSLIQSV